MKNPFKTLLIAAVLVLSGCAQTMPAPQSPAQAIYQLTGTYAAALSAEVNYAKLPRCKENVIRLCSKPEVITAVRRASDVAWTALQGAQQAVRTPGYGSDLATTALTSASVAVNAYLQISADLTRN